MTITTGSFSVFVLLKFRTVFLIEIINKSYIIQAIRNPEF